MKEREAIDLIARAMVCKDGVEKSLEGRTLKYAKERLTQAVRELRGTGDGR